MGSTVVTRKLAAAFKASSGETTWLLFEETYEKNCFPHTPRWSCGFIGALEGALERIFLGASACEGGMLQNRNGWISPESYITTWLKELRAPVSYPDVSIELKIGRDFYATVPSDRWDAIQAKLKESGETEKLIDALSAGNSVRVSLHSDIELVKTLTKAGVSPWRLIGGSWALNGDRYPELGYTPKPGKAAIVEPAGFFKVDRENRLVKQADGSWRCEGWEYSIISSYVADLWRQELATPGCYRKLIQNFRKAIQSAPALPMGTMVVVDRNVPLEHVWLQQCVDELPQKLPVTSTDNGFQVAIPDDPEKLYLLAGLPQTCTRWVVPCHGAA